MKICMVVRHFLHNRLTAIPRVVYEISKRLAVKGHNVLVITNTKYNEREVFIEKNLTLKYLKNFNITQIKDQFDVIHFYGSMLGGLLFLRKFESSLNILSLYTSPKCSKEDFFSVKLSDFLFDSRTSFFLIFSLMSLIPNYILKHILRSSKKIIVNSYRLKESYVNLLDDEKKVIRIPHGIDLSIFADSDNEKYKILKEKLGFFENEKIVAYIGHPYLVRGIDDLIYAIRDVQQKETNVKLLLVLSERPTSTLDHIKKLAFKHLRKSLIKIVTGYVRDIEVYYKLSDVIVLPYRLSLEIPEYPFVLLEAMASAKPIITTNIGAIPEIIKNNYNGLMISPKNSKELAKSIINILNNKRLASKLGKNAQSTVKNFDWNIVADKFLKIYEEILNEK